MKNIQLRAKSLSSFSFTKCSKSSRFTGIDHMQFVSLYAHQANLSLKKITLFRDYLNNKFPAIFFDNRINSLLQLGNLTNAFRQKFGQHDQYHFIQ